MKVRFYCDSGANNRSKRSEELDIEKDLGMTIAECPALSDGEKYKMAERWASDSLEIGYEEL